MKKTVSVLLAVLMVAAICISACAEPVVKPAVTEKPVQDTDKQLDLLFDNLSQLCQETDAKEPWSYAVTDLDHNGSLELIAAIMKSDLNTYAKIFEVGADRQSFVECDMGVKEGEAFADIICDSADAYYDKANDTWYYIFSENYISDANDYYAVKCSVSLKNDYVTPTPYAYEHVTKNNGQTVVEFMDLNGSEITPEQYVAIGTEQYTGLEKSSANFGWFHATEVKNVSALTESYEIFSGKREPNKTKQENSIIIVPVQPRKDDPSGYLRVTKNPTSEYHRAGETAVFISYGQNYEECGWDFVSPNGGVYTAAQMRSMFGCTVSGENGTNLSVGRLSSDMNGWGTYCTFIGNNQIARSSTAYIYIVSDPKPTPRPTPVPTVGPLPSGYVYGYVSNFSTGSVTIVFNNGSVVTVPRSICDIRGQIYDGAPVTAMYEGWIVDEYTVRDVFIDGVEIDDPVYPDNPEIDPVYPVYPDDPEIDPVYPDNEWTCSRCGYPHNSDSSVYCEICGDYRYGMGLIGEESTNDDPYLDGDWE